MDFTPSSGGTCSVPDLSLESIRQLKQIAVANKNKGNREVVFQVEDAHHLPFANDQFEVALVQSILHHDDNPKEVIREAFRVAPTILIHEPNGNNPGLKLIERLSPYHRLHDEKSYTSVQLKRWIRECGGEVIHERFAGFVPMFSPEWLASIMKTFEPLVENTPLVRTVGCAVIVIVARKVTSPA